MPLVISHGSKRKGNGRRTNVETLSEPQSSERNITVTGCNGGLADSGFFPTADVLGTLGPEQERWLRRVAAASRAETRCSSWTGRATPAGLDAQVGGAPEARTGCAKPASQAHCAVFGVSSCSLQRSGPSRSTKKHCANKSRRTSTPNGPKHHSRRDVVAYDFF